MTEDLVKSLGHATLGSRFRRIGELLQSQTGDIAADLEQLEVPIPFHPLLAALDRSGALSVGEISKTLGQSQPGITRMVNQLKDKSIVTATTDADDRRVSKIQLTEEGKTLVEGLKSALWPATAHAVTDVCIGLRGPLLDQLTQLEAALQEKPLRKRVPAVALPHWRFS